MSETGSTRRQITSGLLEEFAKSGFLNIAGGCCGTMLEHIAMIAERVGGTRRACLSRTRGRRGMVPAMKLSGLEPMTSAPAPLRQHRRAHQRHRFRRPRG
jgi:hypothetical protein